MPTYLQSPHRFRERMLFYAGAGAGKSHTALTIARALLPDVHMYVGDNDMSSSYDRALETDFTDVLDDGKVSVTRLDLDWESTLDWFNDTIKVADPGDPTKPGGDWIVLDSISPTWEQVQTWYSNQVHGTDLAAMMVRVRKESTNMREFNAAIVGEMMWPLIKKEYSKLYRLIQGWKGNLILTAEAKELTRNDDDEIRMLYGHIGFKPTGEARLHHVASTNLFMFKAAHGVWKMTTVKDRNREEMDKTVIENFADEYLVDIAGWDAVRVNK